MLTARLLTLAAVLALYDVTLANVVLTDCQADIVFVLDNSASIAGPKANYRPDEVPEHDPSKNWRRMRTFSNNLTSQLNVGPTGSHIALVDFGFDGYLVFDFKTHSTQETVKAAITALPYRAEGTRTDKGLAWARRLLTEDGFGKRGDDVEKIIVLVTDGQPDDQAALDAEVKRIKDLRIRIVLTFVAPNDAIRAKEPLVKPIATGEADYIRLNAFKELDTYQGNVINADTCRRPTVPPPTTAAPPPTTPAPPVTTPAPPTTTVTAPPPVTPVTPSPPTTTPEEEIEDCDDEE